MFDVVGVGANSVDYVYRLPRFPQPDSPAAKLRITHHLISCGGQTATAVCTCAALGLATKYVGTTGNDSNGERMRGELARRGVNVEHTYVRDTINPFAVILLDEQHGERVVLWDRDPALRMQPGEIDRAVIGETRLLHVDDTDEEAAIRAASLAREAAIPVTSDIERVTDRTEELVAAVTIPIFAEHALEPLTGERDFERALRVLQQRRPGSRAGSERTRPTGAGMLCVTLGARGAMLLDGDRLYHEPGRPVTVEDTTGAGDVFRGAFITALLRGAAPAEILRFANAAAAISCTRVGAIPSVPSLAEVDALAVKNTKTM
jgi:sugar/nucleoside kinase (ribokinase family)